MDEDALEALDGQMARLADGDRSACTAVFSLLWPRLVAFAERILGPGADADDAAQQALEKIYEQAPDYDSRRSALGWALSIAAWECRTIITVRRRRKEDSIDETEDIAAPTKTPEEEAMAKTLVSALDAAMADLSERDRWTLGQAFYEEGGDTGVAFRKRKQRAIERLRVAWGKLNGR